MPPVLISSITTPCWVRIFNLCDFIPETWWKMVYIVIIIVTIPVINAVDLAQLSKWIYGGIMVSFHTGFVVFHISWEIMSIVKWHTITCHQYNQDGLTGISSRHLSVHHVHGYKCYSLGEQYRPFIMTLASMGHRGYEAKFMKSMEI